MSYTVRSRLKFGKIFLERPVVYENVKNGYREFDHSSTLSRTHGSYIVLTLSSRLLGVDDLCLR